MLIYMNKKTLLSGHLQIVWPCLAMFKNGLFFDHTFEGGQTVEGGHKGGHLRYIYIYMIYIYIIIYIWKAATKTLFVVQGKLTKLSCCIAA